MKNLASLAATSAWNRRFVLSLIVISIALSTCLLLAVERIRTDIKSNFLSAVSGTDLIVGPPSGSVQMLLLTVFRIGNATKTIRWETAEVLRTRPEVAWLIPISLGDQHRGFPVVATDQTFFERFQYGERQHVAIKQGGRFKQLFDAVVGADVAQQLGYQLGQKIAFTHGEGLIPGNGHEDKPFVITGILERTGTPVDRSIHISLEAMEAIHLDWVGGIAPAPEDLMSAEEVATHDLRPKTLTGALVGLKRRAAVFSMQRKISNYEGEPLMGILPGVALDELWGFIGFGEKGLLAMSGIVSAVSLGGLIAVILAGINERRRELAILRAVGAGPIQVLAVLALEGFLITLAGVAIGLFVCAASIYFLSGSFHERFGFTLSMSWLTINEVKLLAAIIAAGWVASLIPAFRAYRLSLHDGLQPRT